MTSPLTTDPAESADDFFDLADAFALALTLPTVTSPPKIEIDEISADALEVAAEPRVAKAPYVTEPALTTEPSPGYANEPPTPAESGGAETEGVEPPA